MSGKLIFKRVVRLISIPLLVIALALYMPDVYTCNTLLRADLYEVLASLACLQMVAGLQVMLYLVATVFAFILFAFEFYTFKMSFSKKDRAAGQ